MRRPQLSLKQLFIWSLLYALLLAVFLLLPNSVGASSIGLATLSLVLLGDAYRSERSQRDRVMSVSYHSFALSLSLAVAFAMAFVFRPPPDTFLGNHEPTGDPLREAVGQFVWAFVWVIGYAFLYATCSTISFVGAIVRWRHYRLAKWHTSLNVLGVALFIHFLVAIVSLFIGKADDHSQATYAGSIPAVASCSSFFANKSKGSGPILFGTRFAHGGFRLLTSDFLGRGGGLGRAKSWFS